MALRKRSEISKKPPPTEVKPSAAERTPPLPGVTAPASGIVRPGVMHCDACGKDSPVKDATQRPDGDLECPSCGMPVDISKAAPEPVPGRTKTSLDGPPAKEQPKAYCEDCGAEWLRSPATDYKPMPSCGHANGFVDDPRKAKNWKPPAGHATKAATEKALPPL